MMHFNNMNHVGKILQRRHIVKAPTLVPRRVRSLPLLALPLVLTIYMWFTVRSIVHIDQDTKDSARLRATESLSSSSRADAFSAVRLKMKGECDLNPEENSPLPIILMTLGRSGSSSTWQILGNLTGKVTRSEEYPGSDSKQTTKFFTKKVEANDEGKWVYKYLCERQHKYHDAGIVGFKWKPHHKSIHTDAAKAGLALIAASKSHNPTVRIVRSRRNLLDVIISSTKHRVGRAKAHCKAGDTKCVEKHLKVGTGLVLETDSLLKELRQRTREEDLVDRMLVEMDVPHIQVSFEKLFNLQDPEEWMRIFRFLGRGPANGLTWEQVSDAMEHAATSNSEHKVTLRNYEEVQRTLQGTEFEHLLH